VSKPALRVFSISPLGTSAVDSMPCSFSLNSSGLVARRSASSIRDELLLEQPVDRLVEGLHPVLEVPCAIASWISLVLSLFSMQSRTKS